MCKSTIMGQSSFNVDSLFTRVLMREAFNLTSRHFKKEILNLLHDVLNPSSSTFGGQLYMQTNGPAMGLLLSPMTADSYTDDFELKALHHIMFCMILSLMYSPQA
jgi:hypothetical protein